MRLFKIKLEYKITNLHHIWHSKFLETKNVLKSVCLKLNWNIKLQIFIIFDIQKFQKLKTFLKAFVQNRIGI